MLNLYIILAWRRQRQKDQGKFEDSLAYIKISSRLAWSQEGRKFDTRTIYFLFIEHSTFPIICLFSHGSHFPKFVNRLLKNHSTASIWHQRGNNSRKAFCSDSCHVPGTRNQQVGTDGIKDRRADNGDNSGSAHWVGVWWFSAQAYNRHPRDWDSPGYIGTSATAGTRIAFYAFTNSSLESGPSLSGSSLRQTQDSWLYSKGFQGKQYDTN